MVINSALDSPRQRLEVLLRASGPSASEDICRQLAISQPSLSRAVAAAKGRISMFGRGKATRYAVAREIATAGSEFPLYAIDEAGSPTKAGVLHSVSGGRYWLQPPGGLGQVFPDLPYFLQDMRPQGYLGRSFPRQHGHLIVPPRIADWASDHVTIALALAGEDCVGNLVLGRESMNRLLAREPRHFVGDDEIAREYPRLAQLARDGEPVGSSAGGEQPKFAVARENPVRGSYHALVKFSPPLTTPEGERWGDLLRCESIAPEMLEHSGVDASRGRHLVIGDRAYLEVERFDRVGPDGRRGLVSLGAVDDEFFGSRDRYSLAGERLMGAGMLPPEDAGHLAFLEAFGMLIANEDMHFGNVSLFSSGPFSRRFALAPAYDMLPMRYRPRDEDPMPDPGFEPPAPHAGVLEAWAAAVPAATLHWERVAEDQEISAGFRRIAVRNRDSVRAIVASRPSRPRH
ncbi:MAG: type II toxin-antitoxin system HipA family toxin YjjJ [Betaproteobacteria bacterium]|nr:type II toxin-antitoxin system HipA family toxin YjjJ [Betaproteobacteria bacterium]